MGNAARIWKYALGSFSDDRTKEYDNHVLVVRSVISVSYTHLTLPTTTPV